MKYRIKTAFHGKKLITQINGVRVSLNGDVTDTIPGDGNEPPQKINVPAATQAQMAQLFQEGNPCIEQYEPVQEPKAETKSEGK